MNTTTAAKQAGVTVDTIRTWARMGAIRATKQVGRWAIDPVSLRRRIAMGTPTATTTKKVTMKNTNITITVDGAQLYLTAPYSPAANADYKGLNGRWAPARKAWKFAANDIEAVRETVRDHFGYDDRPVETVTVRVALEGEFSRGDNELEMFSRTLARRPGRDADVELARGVRLIDGQFDGSAGSTRYPSLGDVDGIVLEVRDVPADHTDLTEEGVTIMTPDAPAEVDTARAALEAERATLIARLAEIDAQLAQ